MKRRGDDDESSLDLLLDTICNTFGGVLFISMLVVIMLNLSSNQAGMMPPDETSQAELIQWETRLAQTNADLERLQTALEQQEQIERHIVDPELRTMVRKARQSRQQTAQLMSDKTTNLAQITKSQKEVNRIATEIAQQERAMQNAQQTLEEVQRRMAQEIASRTRAAKLPKARRTQKVEIPLFLRNGRLCLYARRGRGGHLVPNDAEFIEKQDENNKAYVEPKAGAGIAVELRGRDANAVDQKLDQFDASEHYLAVFVWPNSFPHFAVVKDRMVSCGFEYRLVPFPEDGKIYVGGSDENVLVQ